MYIHGGMSCGNSGGLVKQVEERYRDNEVFIEKKSQQKNYRLLFFIGNKIPTEKSIWQLYEPSKIYQSRELR